MTFLRTLFWIAITAIVVVFSIKNWVPVTVSLFGDMQADVKLPVLLSFAFLVGFLPMYLWHHAFRWRQRRKSSAIERAPAVVAAPPPLRAAPPEMPRADPFGDD